MQVHFIPTIIRPMIADKVNTPYNIDYKKKVLNISSNHHHHHCHQSMQTAQIPLTLSHHPSLLTITFGWSSRRHPESK